MLQEQCCHVEVSFQIRSDLNEFINGQNTEVLIQFSCRVLSE